MKREEAHALRGKAVSVWTAANGMYVGILEEVLPTRPWRAKVRVTGVLSPAVHYERGGACRRGFRPGEYLEVGGSSVQPDPKDEGTDYLTSVRHAKAKSEQWYAADPLHRDAWTHKGTAEALTLVLAAEERRLAGSPWVLRPPLI